VIPKVVIGGLEASEINSLLQVVVWLRIHLTRYHIN
jgi:hypothetical protein